MQITQGGGKPRKGAFRWFLLCFTDHLHPYSLPLGQLSVDWTPAFSCREAHNKPPSPPTPNSHPFRVLNWCHWSLQNPPRFRQAAHFMLVKMEMTTFCCSPCPRIPKHPSSRKSQTQRKQRASYQATSFMGLHPWVLNMLADTQAFWNALKKNKTGVMKKARWNELNCEKSRETSSSQVKMRLFPRNHWYCKKHPPY